MPSLMRKALRSDSALKAPLCRALNARCRALKDAGKKARSAGIVADDALLPLRLAGHSQKSQQLPSCACSLKKLFPAPSKADGRDSCHVQLQNAKGLMTGRMADNTQIRRSAHTEGPICVSKKPHRIRNEHHRHVLELIENFTGKVRVKLKRD